MKFSVPIFRLKRKAKLLSREGKMPLHAALDQVAREEGFSSWSLLASSASAARPVDQILGELVPGDLVLLGARPGQGKTLLGLEVAAGAVGQGRSGYFFTLEYTETQVATRLSALGVDAGSLGERFHIDTSNEICAAYIMEQLRGAPSGTVAVVDYLQILDQKRAHPSLKDQLDMLRAFAKETGVILLFILQIDRAFEGQAAALPQLSDVRLPNPLDLKVFSKTCFLHDGECHLDAVA